MKNVKKTKEILVKTINYLSFLLRYRLSQKSVKAKTLVIEPLVSQAGFVLTAIVCHIFVFSWDKNAIAYVVFITLSMNDVVVCVINNQKTALSNVLRNN